MLVFSIVLFCSLNIIRSTNSHVWETTISSYVKLFLKSGSRAEINLVGGLEHFIFSISYMGCHPNPIDKNIFQRGRIETTKQISI